MATRCSVDGCEGPVRAKGWCNKHYRRFLRTGDPLKAAWERGDHSANFWAKVERTGPHDCWSWAGYVTDDGYPRFVFPGGQQAHRFAYQLTYGPPPEGYDVDHMCHNIDPSCAGGPSCPHRRCVNPLHLRVIPWVRHRPQEAPGDGGVKRGAQQRAKTHCPAGHLYDVSNTYIDPRGRRNCRACRRNKT